MSKQSGEAIEPFSIRASDEDLEDLADRLRRTRWPDLLDDPDWSYGIEQSYLRELARYWLEEYDWREHEARLERYEHFRTGIDGQTVHFMQHRSPHEDALPLVITHGWPGSVVEFLDILEPLADPTAHGGRAEDAFHVICPSLPGYGWSTPLGKGATVESAARLFAKLMARLGHEHYGAQGGDWGSMVSHWIGAVDPEHCRGVHLNFLFAVPPDADALAKLDDEGQRRWGKFLHYNAEEGGYAQIQATKPETLGYGLTDSPVGQLAWIAEKFRTWTDCDGRIENAVSRDALLTNVTLYWLTRTAGSSARLYRENRVANAFMPTEPIEVPLAHACFPGEIMASPREWIEAAYPVTQWTEMPRGGHFAAMEEPGLLVEDIRKFFAPLRASR